MNVLFKTVHFHLETQETADFLSSGIKQKRLSDKIASYTDLFYAVKFRLFSWECIRVAMH